ncbi:MAG TPA: hypothetical protein VNL16_17110 [Chloroflexota bacterium]|nr:hypothetical protein [Chloroflexota bacterium]
MSGSSAVGNRRPPATLRVTRRYGGVVYARSPFAIALDGRVIGAVASEQTVELPIAPGQHTLRLGAGRHVSPTRAFAVDPGEVVSFWCRGQMLWPLYFAALVKPDLWIAFQRA